MRIKELPSRVLKRPVVMGTWMGWQPTLRQEPGYFCYVITCGRYDDGRVEYIGHLMYAAKLDKSWRVIESRMDLTLETAQKVLRSNQTLAIWPETEEA
jgi:hypothetical protein